MIEECLELTSGRSGGKETTRMYEACLDRQLAAQGKGPTQRVNPTRCRARLNVFPGSRFLDADRDL